MQPNPLPSQEYLQTALDYNPQTGILTWKRRPLEHFRDLHAWSAWNGRFAGKEAGTVKFTRYGKPRLQITINWITYFASRVIWKLVTGEEPLNEIDHEDNNMLNNAWSNLRDITNQQNKFNAKTKSNSTTGFKGVKPRNGRFQARIRIGDKRVHLGTFDTPEEAYEAYCEAAKKYHGKFFNPG